MHDHEECCASVFYEGALAAEAILKNIYHVDVRKALDPLNPKDYEKIVHIIGQQLQGHAIPVEKNALKDACGVLDVDWVNISKEARAKVVAAAQKHLGDPIANVVIPKVEQTLAFHAKDLVQNTKSKAIQKFDLNISGNFNATDERIAKLVTASQGHFVRDQFGQRNDKFGALAKMVVSNGLSQGLGSGEISADLHELLGPKPGAQGKDYWDMIAMVFANRARTMTQIMAFGEAGITRYKFDSVLDSVTSQQCRFMHGREFSVAGAMKSMGDVEDADSPDDIKTIQPFMNCSGKNLYFGTGDNRTPVATVMQSAMGHDNKTGTFEHHMDTAALEAAGVRMPPLHGRCRSTVVPLETIAPSGVHAPAPAAPTAAELAPKPSIVDIKTKALADLDVSTTTDVGFHMGDWFDSLADFQMDAPPYLEKFAPDQLTEIMDLNSVSKKPKLQELVATKTYADEDFIRSYIKSPKKLAAAADQVKVVKYQGKLYIVDGHESLAAQKLLGQKQAYVNFTDLDKPLKMPEPKPAPAPTAASPHAMPATTPAVHGQEAHPHAAVAPVVPAMAPPPTMGDANVILGTKLAGPAGSNAGGFYRGTDGVERYVKFYDDPAQAACEHLANRLYRALNGGVGAPNSVLFEHEGKTMYASKILPGVKTLGEVGLTPELAKKVMRGFVTDVLTGNWDAAGMSLDNIVVDAAGEITRIDNGGTFLMRAKNGRKQASALFDITEWDNFFNPNINPAYAKIAKAAGISGPEDMRDLVISEIKKVRELRDVSGGWRAYVDARIPASVPYGDRANMVDMLETRLRLLEVKAAELEHPLSVLSRSDAYEKEVVFHEGLPQAKKIFKFLEKNRLDASEGAAVWDEAFADAKISQKERQEVREAIRGWTAETRLGSTHQKVYASASEVVDGKPNTQLAKSIAATSHPEARAKRWQTIAKKAGVTMEAPTHIIGMRGMDGESWIRDVVRSWQDDEATDMLVKSHEAASWSMSRDTAKEFATNRGSADGVIFKWKIPAHQVFADQVADDGSFVSRYLHEQEVIAGTGKENDLLLPKKEHVVVYKKKEYTYADREALFRKLRADGFRL